MKNFTKNDDGKVRESIANKAKMNVFEYYKYFPRNALMPLNSYISVLIEFFKNLFYFIYSTLFILFFPVVLIALAIVDIKSAKKSVADHNEFHKKKKEE